MVKQYGKDGEMNRLYRPMAETESSEAPIQGMDCAECMLHVQQAIAVLRGQHLVSKGIANR